MELIQKIQSFNKRWGIEDKETHEQKLSEFKVRVLNIFKNIDTVVTYEGVCQFCRIAALPENWSYSGSRRYGKNIIEALKNEKDEKILYKHLELIFTLPMATEDRGMLLKQFSEAVQLSGVNLAVLVQDNEIILFPRGDDELDKKLVDDVFKFLNPKSRQHFFEALKFYDKNILQDRRKSAEAIRRSLEEFLRFKLKNNAGLDANIKALGQLLKKNNSNPQLRNIIKQIFGYLDMYFNENSKHNDGDIYPEENEFLIYQAGLLMRYLSQVI